MTKTWGTSTFERLEEEEDPADKTEKEHQECCYAKYVPQLICHIRQLFKREGNVLESSKFGKHCRTLSCRFTMHINIDVRNLRNPVVKKPVNFNTTFPKPI